MSRSSYVRRIYILRAHNSSATSKRAELQLDLVNPDGSTFNKVPIRFPTIDPEETVEVRHEPWGNVDTGEFQTLYLKGVFVDDAAKEFDAIIGSVGKVLDTEKWKLRKIGLIVLAVLGGLFALMFFGIVTLMSYQLSAPKHYVAPRLSADRSGDAVIMGRHFVADFYRASEVNAFAKKKLMGRINSFVFPRAAVITDGAPMNVSIDGTSALLLATVEYLIARSWSKEVSWRSEET